MILEFIEVSKSTIERRCKRNVVGTVVNCNYADLVMPCEFLLTQAPEKRAEGFPIVEDRQDNSNPHSDVPIDNSFGPSQSEVAPEQARSARCVPSK